jgi:hypothetical protein
LSAGCNFGRAGPRHRRAHAHRSAAGANAYAMIGLRAAAAGIATKLGDHSFGATRITPYSRTAVSVKSRCDGEPRLDPQAQLYDSRSDEVSRLAEGVGPQENPKNGTMVW